MRCDVDKGGNSMRRFACAGMRFICLPALSALPAGFKILPVVAINPWMWLKRNATGGARTARDFQIII